MATTINELFDNIHDLPQIPDVVRELVSQLNDPDIDMSAIAKNVEQEPTISLKILRLVNSAHYGLSRKVASINEALAFLGMDELKTLVIASGIVSSVPKINGVDLDAFWQTAFLKATYAKWLANEIELDGNIAFTAAILSNIGTLLIHLGDANAGLEIDQHLKSGATIRYDYEQRRLGFTSADVSAELSRRWKFSEELIQAVSDSANPLAVDAPSALACTVHIAEYLSHSKSKLTDEEIVENLPVSVGEKINLTKAVLEEKSTALLAMESSLASLAA